MKSVADDHDRAVTDLVDEVRSIEIEASLYHKHETDYPALILENHNPVTLTPVHAMLIV